VAHVRQSRPDSGPGFQGQALKPFELFPPNPPKLLDLEWGPDTLLPSEKGTTYQVLRTSLESHGQNMLLDLEWGPGILLLKGLPR